MGAEVPPQEMVPGLRYTVRINDCCVAGWFTGTLLRLETDVDDPDEPWDRAVFDNGVIGPAWGQLCFEEADD